MTAVLHDWAVCFGSTDPYKPPELHGHVLTGNVSNHPDFPENHPVKTSQIVSAEGRLVTTRSGTVYRLGRISVEYREWMRKEGLPYNPHSPIKVLLGKR